MWLNLSPITNYSVKIYTHFQIICNSSVLSETCFSLNITIPSTTAVASIFLSPVYQKQKSNLNLNTPMCFGSHNSNPSAHFPVTNFDLVPIMTLYSFTHYFFFTNKSADDERIQAVAPEQGCWAAPPEINYLQVTLQSIWRVEALAKRNWPN